MTSSALKEWQGPRSDRIDELFDAHRQVGGTGSGRRWRTEQLNWALILRVAAEFQGFARSLHDEAVDYLAPRAGGLNATLTLILRGSLTDRRSLDKGNATPGNLGTDFGRLGMNLWPELYARDARAAQWRRTVEAMNMARNAIAHANQAELAELTADGWNLSHLATIRRFRGASGNLAAGMDRVVSAHLERLFGEGKPW